MATSGKKPPDRGGGKFYKCHSDTRVNAVVCVICEDVYHINDFMRTNGGIQISDTFVICKEHKEVRDLTSISDHVLEEEVKIIIAQIKNCARLELQKKTNEYDKIKQNLDNKIIQQENRLKEQEQLINQMEQEKITELQKQKINSSYTMDLDQTVHDESVFEQADMEVLKAENKMYKQLNIELKDMNNELKDKNDMLKKMLQDKESVSDGINPVTFAEVAAGKIQRKPKKQPSIIIKKTNKEETLKELSRKVRHYLIQDKSIQTNTIKEREKSEEIIITCNDKLSVDKTLDLLKNEITDDVAIEEKNKPKMKIVGINNLEKMNNQQLEEDINERNFSKFSDQKCKILHSYTTKIKGTLTVLIEVTADLHKFIKDNKNKIYVGHQKCMTYDTIDCKPCYNCGIFGHKGKKCRNTATCTKCAESHKVSECESESSKCTNCIYSNSKYKTSYNIKHEATDLERCEVFKTRVRKYIESTDYIVKPTIPRDIGNVGNYINMPMSARQAGISVENLNSLNEKVAH